MMTSAQIVRTTVIVAAVLAATAAIAAVIVRAQLVVLTLFGAIVIGETLRPIINRLSRGMPRAAAGTIAFTGLYGAFVLVALLPLWALAPQIAAFANTVPEQLSRALATIEEAVASHDLGAHVPGGLEALTANIPAVIGKAIAAKANVVALFSAFGLALVMAIFWIVSSDALSDFMFSLVVADRRADVRKVLDEISRKLGTYLLGVMINGTIVASACTIGLSLAQVPYAPVLGFFQGPLMALPYLGTLTGVLTVGAVVFASQGVAKAAVAMGVVILVTTIEATFISPLIFRKHLGVNPLSTVVGIAVGGTLFGITGVFLAVPAVAVLETTMTRVIAPAIRR